MFNKIIILCAQQPIKTFNVTYKHSVVSVIEHKNWTQWHILLQVGLQRGLQNLNLQSNGWQQQKGQSLETIKTLKHFKI